MKIAAVDKHGAGGCGPNMIAAMKPWAIGFLELAPGAFLVAYSLAQIASGRIPFLAARIWQAPTWLSVILLIGGTASLSLALWVGSLRRRLRRVLDAA